MAIDVSLVRFRSSSGPKKIIDACLTEGKQVAARTQKREQKSLDHMGFLKANNLATLVLDCEFATKKGSESRGFLEGEMVFRP